MGSQEDFFEEAGGGTGYDAVKFKTVNDHVVGTILGEPRSVMRKSLNPPYDLEKQMPVNLDTDGTEAGYRTLWLRKGFLAGAVTEAMTAAGAKKLLPGGKLTVQFIEERPPTQPGHSPAKVFKAKYVPPAESAAPAVTESDLFGE